MLESAFWSSAATVTLLIGMVLAYMGVVSLRWTAWIMAFGAGAIVSAATYQLVLGAIAEEQGHHPDLHVRWGAVGVEVWTHKIDGLTESDFYFAAKCDRAYAEQQAAG